MVEVERKKDENIRLRGRVHRADDANFRVSRQGWLEHPGELGIPVRDVRAAKKERVNQRS